MVEKLASSEIAQSRERFEKWYSKGHKFSFVRRTDIPEAYEDGETEVRWYTWQAAERDTRERCAQTAERIRDKFVKLGMKANAYGADYVAERIRGKE